MLARITAELADAEPLSREQGDRALRLYQKLQRLQEGKVSALVEFQIGRLLLSLGRFAEAAKALTSVQEALEEEDSPRISAHMREQLMKHLDVTYALFGETLLRADRLDEAEAAFRRADQGKPNPALLAFRLALVERERENTTAALELLQQYFDAKSTTEGLAPYFLLAELFEEASSEDAQSLEGNAQGDDVVDPSSDKPSDALLDKFRQLAEGDPSNPALGYYLADALRRAQKWDEAEALFKTWLKRDPAADGYQGLIDIYRQQQRLAPLLEQLAEIVSKSGSLDPLDDIAGKIVQDAALLDRLAEQARTLAADPEESPPEGAWYALALLHARAEQGEAATELFRKGLEQPTPQAGPCAVDLAFTLLENGQPKLAAQVLECILNEKLLPDRSAEIHFFLAGAWIGAKEFDRALAAAREAGRLQPNSPNMLSREAWVLFRANRLHEARAKYIQLLEKADSDHSTLENREMMRDIRLTLSAIDVEREDMAAAEEWLQQVLDEFPQDIGAYNDLGYLWSDQGKHLNRALQMVQKAVETEPDNVAYLDSLGWALYHLERFDEALRPLQKAASSRDVDGVILDHLGDLYMQLKRPSQAVDAWRRAVEAMGEGRGAKSRKAIELKIRQHTNQ